MRDLVMLEKVWYKNNIYTYHQIDEESKLVWISDENGKFIKVEKDLLVSNQKHITSAMRNRLAIDLAIRYGGTDGGHHKMWVIDQMIRILAGKKYKKIIKDAKAGEDGPDTYDWDEGIAP